MKTPRSRRALTAAVSACFLATPAIVLPAMASHVTASHDLDSGAHQSVLELVDPKPHQEVRDLKRSGQQDVAGVRSNDDSAQQRSATHTTELVSADLLPTPQINGVVWEQRATATTVYFGGSFTSARPAGAKLGEQEQQRFNLGAYNLATGALLPFAPQFNGEVKALELSPDGKRLYVGGLFTRVGDAKRYRFAAFDTATGELLNTVRPTFDWVVEDIEASGDTVYIGGKFSSVSGNKRTNVAAVSATSGKVLPWAPNVGGGRILGIAANQSTQEVVLAGSFTTLNGAAHGGWGAVHATSGKTRPWAANSLISNSGPKAAIYSVSADNDRVYVTGYAFRSEHVFEGVAAAQWGGGKLDWVADCLGDHYATAVSGALVYAAGHAHNCKPVGGLPELRPRAYQHALAFSADSPADTKNSGGNFHQKPAPALQSWNPKFTIGGFTGQHQATWDVEAHGQYVLYAGEFTAVNGTPQQGLARFIARSAAPQKMGPTEPLELTHEYSNNRAESFIARTTADPDDSALTYTLLRDGVPVVRGPITSYWYQRPRIRLRDVRPVSGTAKYQLKATDSNGNTVVSQVISITRK